MKWLHFAPQSWVALLKGRRPMSLTHRGELGSLSALLALP